MPLSKILIVPLVALSLIAVPVSAEPDPFVHFLHYSPSLPTTSDYYQFMSELWSGLPEKAGTECDLTCRVHKNGMLSEVRVTHATSTTYALQCIYELLCFLPVNKDFCREAEKMKEPFIVNFSSSNSSLVSFFGPYLTSQDRSRVELQRHSLAALTENFYERYPELKEKVFLVKIVPTQSSIKYPGIFDQPYLCTFQNLAAIRLEGLKDQKIEKNAVTSEFAQALGIVKQLGREWRKFVEDHPTATFADIKDYVRQVRIKYSDILLDEPIM